MPHFTKQISQPGQFYASTPGSKDRKVITITPERQQGWVDQFYRMKNAGLKIPAPFVHRQDKTGLPLTEEEIKDISAKDNCGFWENFWIDKATQKLMGSLNVPLPEDAKRIGTTIQEVSPMVFPQHTDGKNRLWDQEALMHVAVITHPVDSDQDNFVPNNQGTEMGFVLHTGGFQMADDPTGLAAVPPQVPAAVTPAPVVPAGGNDLSAVVQILQGIGLNLPPDTNLENLVERIISAGGQMLKDKENTADEGTTTEPADGSQAQPTPVALAQQNQNLMSIANTSVRQGYINRINVLIQKGTVSPEDAKENLGPMINGFQLSLDATGKPEASNLDTILRTLESIRTLAAPITGLIPGATENQFQMSDKGQFTPVVQEHPTEGNQLEGEDLEKAVQAQLEQAGVKPKTPWSQ